MVAVEAELSGRRRVLDAAADLFVAQGYAGTTLRQIASAAGIKAGSVYHHFGSKEELFVAVLNDGLVVMCDAFAAANEGSPAETSVDQQLRNHVRAHLGAVFEHGPYTTAHVTSFFSAPEGVRQQVVPMRDGYERLWSELFARLFPTLEANDRRVRRLVLFGSMNASAEWFDPAGNLSLDQLASTISTQFLHGVNA